MVGESRNGCERVATVGGRLGRYRVWVVLGGTMGRYGV